MKRLFYAAVGFAIFAAASLALSAVLLLKMTSQQTILIDCTTPGAGSPPITGHPCYDRSAEAVGQIGHIIYCANLYPDRPPPCEDVSSALDTLQGKGRP